MHPTRATTMPRILLSTMVLALGLAACARTVAPPTPAVAAPAPAVAHAGAGEEVYNRVVQVTPLLRTAATGDGQPLVYPAGDPAQATMIRVVIPPGGETGWHRHPRPGFAYIIKGTLTVDIAGREARTYTAGQGFAEVVGVEHNGRNTGSGDVELVALFTSEVDAPITIKRAAPEK